MEGQNLGNIIYGTEARIGINGLREKDEMKIDVFQGRSVEINLTRTKYWIKNRKDKFEADYVDSIFDIPVFKGEIDIEIELKELVYNPDKKRFSRYLIKSMNGRPFRINGTYSICSFLERGDILEIGFNRISFLKKNAGNLKNEESSELNILALKSDINILIEGETGTGKTVLAKTIHEKSDRLGNFIHLNLSSFSPNLVESELFGHVKGAYTGANGYKRGAILEANRGTLFLDEIDSLSLELQTKLLLFLDNREVRHVGGESSIKCDVRLIFASGSKLSKQVEDLKMRKDFYYRISSGMKVDLKPLRENKNKIEEICKTFCKQNFLLIDSSLIRFYKNYCWPGNIRQLISHLEKKKVMGGGRKLVQDSLDDILILEEPEILNSNFGGCKTLEEMKVDYCSRIFIKNNRNAKKTAEVLNISPNTMKAFITKMSA